MASLYIKDPDTADLVTRVAQRQGKTKTQAVRDLFRRAEAELDQQQSPKRKSILQWLEEYHAKNPLPPHTGLKADKAFYDSLNDEDDD